MGTKHGPNRFASYQEVHTKRMQDFLREGFVLSEDLHFVEIGGRKLALEGTITCQGGIVVEVEEVEKVLKIISGDGANAMVQTVQYRYHAYAQDRGNILRYDSPHSHRPYHHVHRHDICGTWTETAIDELRTEDDIPTLSEVLDELREIYYANEF